MTFCSLQFFRLSKKVREKKTGSSVEKWMKLSKEKDVKNKLPGKLFWKLYLQNLEKKFPYGSFSQNQIKKKIRLFLE